MRYRGLDLQRRMQRTLSPEMSWRALVPDFKCDPGTTALFFSRFIEHVSLGIDPNSTIIGSHALDWTLPAHITCEQ